MLRFIEINSCSSKDSSENENSSNRMGENIHDTYITERTFDQNKCIEYFINVSQNNFK